MARFYPLTVVDIQHDTRESVVVSLVPSDEDRNAFEFLEGQYLTFRRHFDGVEVRRCYSICAGRGESPLRIGIKRVDGGCFSSWAKEELETGDILEAMAPMGHFHSSIEPEAAKSYLLFAGGSGITPILSIIRTVLVAEPRSNITLVYGNRSAGAIMFRDELEDLKNVFTGRLSVVHVLESESPEIELFCGRIDRAKCEALFANWIDVARIDITFVCGPEPMMLGVADALRAHGVSEERIKFELFASAQPGRGAGNAVRTSDAARTESAHLTVRLDGASYQIDMPKRDTAILDVALAAELDVPYACKAGVCSTCRAMLVEGEVEMEVNHALEDYEVRRGYVLTCQSRPLSDKVIIDYDQ